MTTPTACRRAFAGGIVAAVAAVHVLRAGAHLDESTAEVLQGLGVPVLGRTFDPLDFVMYGAGVLAAVLLDRLVLRVLCRAPFAPSPPTA